MQAIKFQYVEFFVDHQVLPPFCRQYCFAQAKVPSLILILQSFDNLLFVVFFHDANLFHLAKSYLLYIFL